MSISNVRRLIRQFDSSTLTLNMAMRQGYIEVGELGLNPHRTTTRRPMETLEPKAQKCNNNNNNNMDRPTAGVANLRLLTSQFF
jgi:hypothetical protein